MIQIKIYNYNKSSILSTLTDFSNLNVVLELGNGGRASFDISINLKTVTMSNFRKYNRVVIWDGDQFIFSGYISSWRFSSQNPDKITVNLGHVLELLNKRFTGSAETRSGNLGDSILALLTAYGSGFGITAGTNTTTETGSLEFQRESVLSAMNKLADQGVIEFFTDENDALQVRTYQGNDGIISSRKLRFNESQNNVNNILEFDFLSDGTPIANRIIGLSSALVQTVNSATQEPLLEKVISFSEAKTNPDLLALAESKLDKTEQERLVVGVTIDNDRLPPYSVTLGEFINMTLRKGNLLDVDDLFRITSVQYSFGDTGRPLVTFGVSDTDSKSLAPNFGRDVKQLQDRVSILEKS
jgi:hypothetical protein